MNGKPLFVVMAAAALAGCGVGAVESGGAGVDDGSSALSTVTAGYVTLARDTRTCAAPQCGGLWLSQPNHSLAAIYVASLDFSQSGFSADTVSQVQTAPDGEVVLWGKLTRESRTTDTKNFVVLGAYRGLPGRAPGASDALFTASNGAASKVNSTAKAKNFSQLSVASAAFAFVDQTWLSAQVLTGGALVSGTLQTSGSTVILDGTQVFLPLPTGPAACPQHVLWCPSGTSQVFSRDVNRCVIPTGCAASAICPDSVPACPAGYSLSTWRGAGGCAQFACDPSWTLE